MVRLAASTGMRRSEILGLRWDRLDLEAGTVAIDATLVNVDNEPTFVELTKTSSSRRRIALDPFTVATLKAHQDHRERTREAAGELWQDGRSRLYRRDRHVPIRRTGSPRTFQREARRLGLTPIGVHGLRHSYATTALRERKPVKLVA